MNYVKIYCTNRFSITNRFFFGNKIVYEVLSSCGLSRTCNEYIAIINIFLASCMIFSFFTVSTPMPPSSAFLYYTTIFVKSITRPYWICTGFQSAGTPSTLHSKHSSPPCTGICPHHPQSFATQGSTLF